MTEYRFKSERQTESERKREIIAAALRAIHEQQRREGKR